MTVTPEQLAALVAERTAQAVRGELRALLEDLSSPRNEWIAAKECAHRYGHGERWWLNRKALFGAEPQGDGPRPRWLFNTARIDRIQGRAGL